MVSLNHKNKNSSNEFELAFLDVNEVAILPEFGAEGDPLPTVWMNLDTGSEVGYVEFFGAMRYIQFTFEKVSLKLSLCK